MKEVVFYVFQKKSLFYKASVYKQIVWEIWSPKRYPHSLLINTGYMIIKQILYINCYQGNVPDQLNQHYSESARNSDFCNSAHIYRIKNSRGRERQGGTGGQGNDDNQPSLDKFFLWLWCISTISSIVYFRGSKFPSQCCVM